MHKVVLYVMLDVQGVKAYSREYAYFNIKSKE